MVGLIVTCLPSLRPYLRRDFKASSDGNSQGPSYNFGGSHNLGGSQSIIVNRKVMTSNISGRWREHGQFEEIVSNEGGDAEKGGESKGRIITIGNDVHVDGGSRSANRESWQDDKRSNNSDIELIQIKG
jgi:hypothetical protein